MHSLKHFIRRTTSEMKPKCNKKKKTNWIPCWKYSPSLFYVCVRRHYPSPFVSFNMTEKKPSNSETKRGNNIYIRLDWYKIQQRNSLTSAVIWRCSNFYTHPKIYVECNLKNENLVLPFIHLGLYAKYLVLITPTMIKVYSFLTIILWQTPLVDI